MRLKNFCQVSADIAAYERQLDKQDAWNEAVEDLMCEPDFDPYCIENVAEAISENTNNASLREALTEGDTEWIGRLVLAISEEYWRERAEEELDRLAEEAFIESQFDRRGR